jgi:hypothetical protein
MCSSSSGQVVHLVPTEAQLVHQKYLPQPMPPDDVQRRFSARFGEGNALVLLVVNMLLLSQLLSISVTEAALVDTRSAIALVLTGMGSS